MLTIPFIRHRLPRFAVLLTTLFLLGAASAQAQTVSITGLFTTGVRNDNSLLGSNRQDSHYVVTASSAGATYLGNSYTVTTLAGGWLANTASARWIVAPNGGTNGSDTNRPNGTYDYTLTFTMPTGAMLSSVSITGTAAVDDTASIYVNGTLVSGQTVNSWSSANSFTLNGANSTFVSGSNTITFRVNNSGGGATGIMVTSLSGTAIIPEVGTVLPVALAVGLGGFGSYLRRRKRAGTPPAASA